MREAHFPGLATIDAYGSGGFRFAEMSHTGSLLCLPSGIYGWSVKTGSEIDKAALEQVWRDAEELEVFFVGMGADFGLLPKALKEIFASHSIIVEAMSTGSAISTYNVLLGEGRAVGCGLIAVGGDDG